MITLTLPYLYSNFLAPQVFSLGKKENIVLESYLIASLNRINIKYKEVVCVMPRSEVV